jgi:NADP-dependent 3-hydroxy acid dehydrogenase YdfG
MNKIALITGATSGIGEGCAALGSGPITTSGVF